MELTLDQLKAAGDGLFPGLIGVEVDSLIDGVVQRASSTAGARRSSGMRR